MKSLIGVSSCLLGQEVRWDGRDARNDWIVGVLSVEATLVPVCPEVEIGLETPREPIELVRGEGGTRLQGVETRTDHTERMRTYAQERAEQLEALGVAGFVLKSASPSCGLGGVPLHGADGAAAGAGRGRFAHALVARLPGLPVVEERDLQDAAGRNRFLSRVRAYGGASVPPLS